jgi:hypothetical protein
MGLILSSSLATCSAFIPIDPVAPNIKETASPQTVLSESMLTLSDVELADESVLFSVKSTPLDFHHPVVRLFRFESNKSKGSSVSGITFIRYAQIEILESQITNARPLAFIAPKTLSYLAFQIFNLSVPDEGYSRNARPK